MTVPEGHFRLYASMRPHLTAGSYRFRTSQTMSATAPDNSTRSGSQLPVAELPTHVEVTSPRYQLPPDQILSTWPPAGSEGAYGSRLPQIVIKRRTLPWERDVVPGTVTSTPWLALVVVAEGEAGLELNQPVSQCVTPGVSLPGEPDVPLGTYLSVRRSAVDALLPTRKDVPLLAHVREVDISDTEMMMGDDDGFVAVVVANRLPLAGRTSSGDEAPVKYLAALISLEGQLDVLLPEAPAPTTWTALPLATEVVYLQPHDLDKTVMTGAPGYQARPDVISSLAGLDAGTPGGTTPAPRAAAQHSTAWATPVLAADAQAATAYSGAFGWPTDTILDADTVTAHLSQDFLLSDAIVTLAEPVYRFPVLAHWSFTSFGDTTFESLMGGLGSALLGPVPTPSGQPEPEPPVGRPPLMVLETGHVELPHRTRHGDLTSAWYRGPLTPHPTDSSERLPLAHAPDQLRIVVPDGREDLSLATAFEIGRLMALAHPSLIDAMLRWRQEGFQLARGRTLLDADRDFELAPGVRDRIRDLPLLLARKLLPKVVARPADILGDPLEMLPRGTDMDLIGSLGLDATLPEALAHGLAVDVDLTLSAGTVLGRLQHQPVQHTQLDPRVSGRVTSEILTRALDLQVTAYATSTLGTDIVKEWLDGTLTWDLLDVGDIDIDRIGRVGDVIGRVGPVIRPDVGPVVTPRMRSSSPVTRARDALDDLVAGRSPLAERPASPPATEEPS